MNFMNTRTRIRSSLLITFLMFALAEMAFAQMQKERTLDEIKTEALKRAENGMYPLIGLDPADVKEAFASIKTSDNDEWAAGFSRPLHDAGEIVGIRRSGKSQHPLHQGVAALFFCPVARACISRQATRLRESPRSISRSC
jgi:hypothetical protein